jgi:hypothetical protein
MRAKDVENAKEGLKELDVMNGRKKAHSSYLCKCRGVDRCLNFNGGTQTTKL